jgi:xylan 1,4-beta-xylosidase
LSNRMLNHTRFCLMTAILMLSAISCVTPTRPVLPPSIQVPATSSIPAPTTQVPSALPDITFTLGNSTGGAIKPLLGVNIGPLPAGTSPQNANLTSAYQQIGVNLIRTHDYYGPLDMSQMYPDRLRDPSNPQSYNFTKSDQTWQAILNGGFEPYFRLGDSWNNARPPANAQERANWVKAAVEVLRHYREGKWQGFTSKFRYVEIWNEPDNQQFWPKPHTPQEYFQLYLETATAIRQAFPELKIGGPALTPAGALASQGKKWTQDFLDFVKQNNAPLDFFSWHMYSNIPQQYADAAIFYRNSLDTRGFSRTHTHITEWNTDIKRDSDNSAESLALRTGGKGATILTAAWIALQQNNVAESMFYRGPDPDIKAPTFYGLFYADGKPKHIALAFSLWLKMTSYPERLIINTSSSTSLWVLAGQNSVGEIALLIANPDDKTLKWGFNFADQRRTSYKISLFQVNDASEQTQTSAFSNHVLEIGANTIQLLILKP